LFSPFCRRPADNILRKVATPVARFFRGYFFIFFVATAMWRARKDEWTRRDTPGHVVAEPTPHAAAALHVTLRLIRHEARAPTSTLSFHARDDAVHASLSACRIRRFHYRAPAAIIAFSTSAGVSRCREIHA